MARRKPSCLLPDHIVPLSYDIWLKPDMFNFTFEGAVTVEIYVRKPTKEIIMHANDLKDFRLPGPENFYPPMTIDFDPKNQLLRLRAEDLLPFGTLSVSLRFSGEINDKLCGLYRAKYNHPDGTEHFVITTQCEAIDARRVFPCFDEPRWKTPFKLTVDIPKHFTAVSNMPVKNEQVFVFGNLKRVSFMPTPPMSTYLFALLIGEFDESKWPTGKTKDGVMVRVISVPGKEAFGELALGRGVRTLEFFSDYYHYGYPLPKCDLGAVPNFGAGAMENWGLDLFRESALHVDPKNSSRAGQERVELIIDHELGHQWHGDVVTMVWWDDISLNEAFATWTELLVARNLDPEKGAEEKFMVEDFVGALDADALKTTRPIYSFVDRPDEIGEMFDAVTYFKGGSVLRMLESYISPEKFREAMRLYIPRHEYGTVTKEDLWSVIGEVSGEDVPKVMDAWWNKPGYPVVTVNMIDSNFDRGYELRQHRFLSEIDAEFNQEAVWEIPMRIRTSLNPEKVETLLMSKDGLVPNVPGARWVVWNAGGTGFYRVSYTSGDLHAMATALQNGEIDNECERITLVNDVYSLAKAGYYDTPLMFEFFRSLRNERNPRVLQVALGAVSNAMSLFANTPSLPAMEKFVRDTFSGIGEELGWDEKPEESYQNQILRPLVLLALGAAGHVATVREARKRFAQALVNLESLNPNLRGAVYRIMANYGDEDTYEEMLRLYRSSDSDEEKGRLFAGLASFRKRELIERSLALLLTDAVRSQDVYVYLRPIAANPAGRDMTWKFVKENWGAICRMYEGGKLLGRVIPVCSRLTNLADEEDVRKFFEEHPVPDAKRTIAQALELIRINAKWYKRDHEKLAGFFQT